VSWPRTKIVDWEDFIYQGLSPSPARSPFRYSQPLRRRVAFALTRPGKWVKSGETSTDQSGEAAKFLNKRLVEMAPALVLVLGPPGRKQILASRYFCFGWRRQGPVKGRKRSVINRSGTESMTAVHSSMYSPPRVINRLTLVSCECLLETMVRQATIPLLALFKWDLLF
jgi:hypothetical protein